MHSYKFTVYAALYGWIPLVLCLFAIFPPRKALMIGFIGGWMFLPVAFKKLPGIPAYSKLTAASYASLLGTMIFAPKLLSNFKLKWFDLPVIIWCGASFITSVTNDLGAYDGGSAVIEKAVLWAMPYFLGRIYFPDWDSLSELGVAIVAGTLIYCPLCWFEIRFSPQLHKALYGFHQNDFSQTMRMGGYRPMIFMQHGLAVAMWMNGGALIGTWMWMCGSLKKLWGIPVYIVVPTILVTTLWCRSLGGLLLLFAGFGVLFSIKFLRTPVPLVIVMLVAPVYMSVRGSGAWDGSWAVAKATQLAGEARAQSLLVRVNAENTLARHALEQPWFGWGRWNRNRVTDARGRDSAVTDGLWILALGTSGVVGLVALTIMIQLPALLVWGRCPIKLWTHPGIAAAAAMAVLLVLHMIDNILNGMLDPVFMLAIGGLTAVQPSIRAQLRAPARAGFPMLPPVQAQVAAR